jgi:hypothetical protein
MIVYINLFRRPGTEDFASEGCHASQAAAIEDVIGYRHAFERDGYAYAGSLWWDGVRTGFEDLTPLIEETLEERHAEQRHEAGLRAWPYGRVA